VSDPTEPVERERLTRDDGLPAAPITSEVGPDSEVVYLFTADAESVRVNDLEAGVVEGELDVGGRSISGAWGPRREKLYVPVQTANQVAVIDHANRTVATTIDAGASPTGAVAGTIRPDTDASQRLLGSLSTLGVDVGEQEMAYCPDGNCYCG
jgi:YVTN family beta-propeller protein